MHRLLPALRETLTLKFERVSRPIFGGDQAGDFRNVPTRVALIALHESTISRAAVEVLALP